MKEQAARICEIMLITSVCGLQGCPIDNYGPSPPSSDSLAYSVDVPLTYTQGMNYLKANVDSEIGYLTPKDSNSNDCGHNNTNARYVRQDISMSNPTDYIDFTINDRDGISPGLGQSKSYQLVWFRDAEHEVVWNFNMRQGSPATDFLHIVRWRIKLNGDFDIDKEVGDGSTAYPPDGGMPWERSHKNDIVRGQYRLYRTDGLAPSGLTAALTFSIVNGPFKVCH